MTIATSLRQAAPAWRKRGVIFQPSGQTPWMQTHATIPFPLSTDGGVLRILCSGRDATNRSHTGIVEVDLENPGHERVSTTPLLSPGEPGSFDEDGAMGCWLVRHKGKLFLYYAGWNRGASVPFRNSLGLAISTNEGHSFEKLPGPVLDRSIHDPCFIGASCVLVDGGVWRMWYLSGIGWEPGDDGLQPRYHIKYAESSDGIEWQRDGTVCVDFAGPHESAISRPCVIRDGNVYRMWYSYRGDSYRIGYAESKDGIHWQRLDALAGIDVSAEGWDSEMVEYPYVFDHQGRRLMLYNGNGYGASGFGLAELAASDVTE